MNLHPGFLRLRSRAAGRAGFTLIEAVFAMVLFAGIAAAMAGLLTSAISANKLARQRTIADQATLEHIESIRRLPYEDVGIVAGNPPGVVPATTPIALTGLTATITTQIRYIDDPTPTSYETTANYKRVTATVRRDSDSKVLAREVTYVAPASRTPFGGVNLAIIQALVIDYGLNVPVEGVNVALATGPSAPRNDVTDATGQIVFPKLTPNATPTCPSDCYDLTASLSGYVMLDEPLRLNVGPGETATPTLQIYRPATINVVLQDSSGAPFTATTSVKFTSARNGATETFTVSGGSAAITAVSGEEIVPSVQYTGEAWTTGGTPLCATPVTKYVPDDYPTVMSTTFVLVLDACPAGDVEVTVTWGTGPAAGAIVTLSGGPYSLSPVSGPADTSGLVSFSNVPAGAGYTVTATKAGQSAPTQNISVTTGSTTNVAMALPTGTLRVRARQGTSTYISGATVVVSGGPNNVTVTGTTSGSLGLVTFTNMPGGSGYTIKAYKCSLTSGYKSRQLSGVTVTPNATTTRIAQFNSNTCPLP